MCSSDLEERTPFTAFSVRGENQAEHRLYLCFDHLFDWVREPELKIYAKAASEGEQEALLDLLVSDQIRWSMLEPQGKETVLLDVKKEDGHISIHMEDYHMTAPCRIPRLSYTTIIPRFYVHNVASYRIFANIELIRLYSVTLSMPTSFATF